MIDEEEDVLQLPFVSDEPGLRHDGERTPSRGPCKCGYKHWVDGKEFDFAFKWANFDGFMGFNLGDNAFIAAEKFVVRYDNSRDSLNHRNHVNRIADAILKHIAPFEPVRIDKPKSPNTFDPYKPTLHIPDKNTTFYNKTKGEVVSIDYASNKPTPDQRELNKRKFENEELQRKLKKSAEDEKKLKSEITLKMKRDQEEVEKDRELRKLRGSTPKKESGNQVPVVDENGNMTWVEKSPTIVAATQPNSRGLRSLNNRRGDDSDSDSDEYEGKPKEEWTFPMLIRCLQKEDRKATEQRMIKSGFTEEECHELFKKVAKIAVKSASEMRQHQQFEHHQPEKTQTSPSAFAGKGFTLGGQSLTSSTENQNPTENNNQTNGKSLELNENEPQTQIKVRLINGQNVIVNANHTHTLQQLMDHIKSISNTQTFQLKDTGCFPPKVISNLSDNIKDAKLINGTLVQIP